MKERPQLSFTSEDYVFLAKALIDVAEVYTNDYVYAKERGWTDLAAKSLAKATRAVLWAVQMEAQQ
jgi:hypothetical protein